MLKKVVRVQKLKKIVRVPNLVFWGRVCVFVLLNRGRVCPKVEKSCPCPKVEKSCPRAKFMKFQKGSGKPSFGNVQEFIHSHQFEYLGGATAIRALENLKAPPPSPPPGRSARGVQDAINQSLLRGSPYFRA